MSSKTKIVVLHMKEIIYTAIFITLMIVFILLLLFMFLPRSKETSGEVQKYTPGIYTSQITVGNTDLEVEVTTTKNEISSVRFSNLNETVSAMYPLIQPTMEEIAEQVLAAQNLSDIQYSEENAYTAQVIINAIDEALKKATAD